MPRIGFIKASVSIHRALLVNVMRLPMEFFWANPAGRLLSRFSKDIDIIDERLPDNFEALTYFSFEVIHDVN